MRNFELIHRTDVEPFILRAIKPKLLIPLLVINSLIIPVYYISLQNKENREYISWFLVSSGNEKDR